MLPWSWVYKYLFKSRSSYFLKQVAKLFFFFRFQYRLTWYQENLPSPRTVDHGDEEFSGSTSQIWSGFRKMPLAAAWGCWSLALPLQIISKVSADPAFSLLSTVREKLCSLELPEGHQKQQRELERGSLCRKPWEQVLGHRMFGNTPFDTSPRPWQKPTFPNDWAVVAGTAKRKLFSVISAGNSGCLGPQPFPIICSHSEFSGTHFGPKGRKHLAKQHV